MFKLIIKNSAIYGVLPQVPKLASFFVLPFITPFLTPTDYGVIGIIDVYVGLLSAFSLLGLNVVVSNAFIKHQYHYLSLWRQVYGFLTVWLLLYGVVLAFVLWFVMPVEADEHKATIVALKVIPIVLFAPGEFLMSTYYRMKQKAWPLGLRAATLGCVGVGLTYYFVAGLKLGFMGWIFSAGITTTASGIVFTIPLWSKIKLYPNFRFKRKMMLEKLKISLPMIPHSYSGYLLNSSDRLIMEQLRVSTQSIGLYSLAYSFGSLINTMSGAINQAIGPNLLELINKKNWIDYRKLIFVFQFLVLSLCFTLCLWIDFWLPVVIRNEQLLAAKPIIVIIMMSYSYFPMYVGCNQVLFYYERTGMIWKITAIAGVLNVVANLVFIPIYGFTAAAWTTFGAFLFKGFSGFFHEHYRSLNQSQLNPIPWLMLILIGTFLAYFEQDLGLGGKLILNVIFILCLVGFLAFSGVFKHVATKSVNP